VLLVIAEVFLAQCTTCYDGDWTHMLPLSHKHNPKKTSRVLNYMARQVLGSCVVIIAKQSEIMHAVTMS
jgi:hypothetical protein